MPTILTPQGWVKVAPPAPKRRTVAVNPANALKGPLAYFSCQRSPPKVLSGTLDIPEQYCRQNKKKDAFPYDLGASPEKLARGLGRRDVDVRSGRQEKANVKLGSKNRTISAPQPRILEEDGSDDESRSSSASRSTRSPSSHREKKSRSRRHHHEDEMSSISSSSSRRSHSRHRPAPVEATPRAVSMYAHHHVSPPVPMGGGYHSHHAPPPAMPYTSAYNPPPPPSSGRSMSYSWYNATTPLNL